MLTGTIWWRMRRSVWTCMPTIEIRLLVSFILRPWIRNCVCVWLFSLNFQLGLRKLQKRWSEFLCHNPYRIFSRQMPQPTKCKLHFAEEIFADSSRYINNSPKNESVIGQIFPFCDHNMIQDEQDSSGDEMSTSFWLQCENKQYMNSPARDATTNPIQIQISCSHLREHRQFKPLQCHHS